MKIYFIFYLYNLLSSLINSKKLYYIFNPLIFILIFGLRFNVGVDWGIYERYFYGEMSNNYEIGFSVLNKIIYDLFGNFNVLVLIIFIFTTIIQLIAIREFTEYENLGLVTWLGMGFLSFGILRQSIAISIILIALIFLSKKKLKSYIIAVLIATLFHSSAIAILIFTPILIKNMTKKKAILIIVISILIYLLKLDAVILNIGSKLPMLGEKINFYIDKDSVFNNPLGLGVRFIEAIILFVVCSVNKDKLEHKHKNFNFVYRLLVIYISIYLTLNSSATVAARQMKYFEIAHVILFTYIIMLPKNRSLKYFMLICVYVYIFMRYYMTLTGAMSLQSNIDSFYPYRNYLIEILKT